MPKRIAPFLGALVCALLLLSSCVPASSVVSRAPTPTSVPGTELPFEVVMHAESSAYTGEEPALFFVTSNADAQAVSANLKGGDPEEFSNWVQKLDKSRILLAIFRERHPMGGYEIRTNRVMLQDNTLYVYAELCDIEGGRPGIAMVTSYFQVVQVTLPVEATSDLRPVLVAYPVNC